MANNQTWRFPEDPTGKASSNRVVDEIVSVPSLVSGDRIIVPSAGAFFVDETLVLKDYATNTELKHGTDYRVGGYVTRAQQKSGKDVALYIIVKTNKAQGVFNLAYQAFGGPDFVSVETIAQMIKDLMTDNRPIPYASITEKPEGFNPGAHIHDAGDMYGREYELDAINKLRQAFELQQASVYITSLNEYIDRFFKDHLQVTGDPHPQYMKRSEVILPAAVRKPIGLRPANNAVGVDPDLDMAASAYRSLYSLAQAGATWQVSTDRNFNTILASNDSQGPGTSYKLPARLNPQTNYFWRVRYKDSENAVSDWSDPISFTTSAVSITRPSVLQPAAGATGVTLMPTLVASNFGVVGTTDTYVSTDWEIYSDVGLTTRVWGTVGLTTITVPGNILTQNKTYYVRCRHKGSSIGDSSWSDTVSFATLVFPAQGTFIRNVCHGTTQWDVVADGNGGEMEQNAKPNSLACGWIPPEPKDKLLSQYCTANHDLFGRYADGNYGYYDKLIEPNSVQCGGVEQRVLKPTIGAGVTINKRPNSQVTDDAVFFYELKISPFAVNVLSDQMKAMQVEIYATADGINPANGVFNKTYDTASGQRYWFTDFGGNGRFLVRARYQGLFAGFSEYSDWTVVTVNAPEDIVYHPQFTKPGLSSADYGLVYSTASGFNFDYSVMVVDGVANQSTANMQHLYLNITSDNGGDTTYTRNPSDRFISKDYFGSGYGVYHIRVRVDGEMTDPKGNRSGATSEWSDFARVIYSPPPSIFNTPGVSRVLNFDPTISLLTYRTNPITENNDYGELRYKPRRSIVIDPTGNLYVSDLSNGNSIMVLDKFLLPGHDGNEIDIWVAKLDSSASSTWPSIVRGVWYDFMSFLRGQPGLSLYDGAQRLTIRAKNNPSDFINVDYNTSYEEISFTPKDDPNKPPPSFTCFPAGVLITMADGSHKDIKDIVVGDELMSNGGNSTKVEAIETPFLGNRMILEFEGTDSPLRWSEEHPIWAKSNGKQWWWSCAPDTWLAEVEAGATVGLKDNSTMMTGHEAEFAHIDGWKQHDIRVNHEYGPDTKLYLPKTNGAPIIANGYLVSGGTNENAFDYNTIDWNKDLKFWKMVKETAKKEG